VTIPRCLGICLVAALITMVNLVFGQTAAPAQDGATPAQHTERQAPPTRDPNIAGYVVAKEVLPLVEFYAQVKLTKDPENPAALRSIIRYPGEVLLGSVLM
jgi:hypothetical protein